MGVQWSLVGLSGAQWGSVGLNGTQWGSFGLSGAQCAMYIHPFVIEIKKNFQIF